MPANRETLSAHLANAHARLAWLNVAIAEQASRVAQMQRRGEDEGVERVIFNHYQKMRALLLNDLDRLSRSPAHTRKFDEGAGVRAEPLNTPDHVEAEPF
jgi:hypothetical protein